jgi:hypothetical protein
MNVFYNAITRKIADYVLRMNYGLNKAFKDRNTAVILLPAKELFRKANCLNQQLVRHS